MYYIAINTRFILGYLPYGASENKYGVKFLSNPVDRVQGKTYSKDTGQLWETNLKTCKHERTQVRKHCADSKDKEKGVIHPANQSPISQ